MLLVVVVEPHPRSLEVGRRLRGDGRAKNISRRIAVANKVGADGDLRSSVPASVPGPTS
jgi:CO dehydrogenase nickel-insertion accessory protein CooC1